jgi:hypothetical protein
VSVQEVLPGAWRAIFLACIAAALVPLPLGFVEEWIALIAGVWGLYFVLPMALAVAGAVLAARYRVPRVWTRSFVAVVALPLLLWFAYWSFWLLPFGFLTIFPAVVIVRAAAHAWRRPADGLVAAG